MKKTKFSLESEKYAKENPFVEKGKPESPVFFSAAWERSCDHCQHQEGRHYCLLHGITVKNMDALCCLKWEERDEKDNIIKALQANITEIMANKAELARKNEELKNTLKDCADILELEGCSLTASGVRAILAKYGERKAKAL